MVVRALRSRCVAKSSAPRFGWESPALNVIDCVLSLNRRCRGFVLPRVTRFNEQCSEVEDEVVGQAKVGGADDIEGSVGVARPLGVGGDLFEVARSAGLQLGISCERPAGCKPTRGSALWVALRMPARCRRYGSRSLAAPASSPQVTSGPCVPPSECQHRGARPRACQLEAGATGRVKLEAIAAVSSAREVAEVAEVARCPALGRSSFQGSRSGGGRRRGCRSRARGAGGVGSVGGYLAEPSSFSDQSLNTHGKIYYILLAFWEA